MWSPLLLILTPFRGTAQDFVPIQISPQQFLVPKFSGLWDSGIEVCFLRARHLKLQGILTPSATNKFYKYMFSRVLFITYKFWHANLSVKNSVVARFQVVRDRMNL